MFYVRRALRLFPLYCLAIAIVIVGTHFLQGFRTWMDIPLFIYGANIVVVLPHSFTRFPPYFDCTHFWALALEEQFYSVWPLIVFLVARRRTLIYICSIGIVAALALRVGATVLGFSLWIPNTQLPMRMDSLLAGALFALALRGPNPAKWLNPARLKWILLTSALMLIAVVASARTLFWMSTPMCTVGFSVLAVMYTCILALALIPGTITHQIGGNRILRFFGRYSYGIYVWHYLTYQVCSGWYGAFQRSIHPGFLANIVYVAAMLALSLGAPC